MSVIGALTTLGLWLIGVPSALALGLLAGLAEFVPLIGPIAAAIPALLVASSQGMDGVMLVAALYLVIQQLEGYLLTPLVTRELASVPPALTLFAIVAAGLALGVLGILFAAPLTVVAYLLVRKLYVEHALGKP